MNQLLTEAIDRVLEEGVSTEFLHFTRSKAEADEILEYETVFADKDGLAYAIPVGGKYTKNNIETDYSTGKLVRRTHAVRFRAINKPKAILPKNKKAEQAIWDGDIQIYGAKIMTAQQGKSFLNED